MIYMEKLKSLCSLQYVVFLLFLFNIVSAQSWTPHELFNITQGRDFLIDPNNYINKSGSSYSNVEKYVKEIEEIRNFQVYIYFIDSIGPGYDIKFLFTIKKDIQKFVNDLAFLVSGGNLEADKNSLFILFSIEDRQNRISTGSEVRKYLTDAQSSGYLKKIRSKLQYADYTGALEDLMYNINWRTTKDTTFYDLLDNLYIILIVLGLCFCCCAYVGDERGDLEKTRDQEAEKKLEKIKQITEKNKDNTKFLDDNCIICLDEFSPEYKNNMTKNNNKLNDNIENKNNINYQKEYSTAENLMKSNPDLHQDNVVKENDEKSSLLLKKDEIKTGNLICGFKKYFRKNVY